MANFTLTPVAALGSANPQIDDYGTLTIAENMSCSLASLSPRSGKDKGFNAAVKRMFKTALPASGKMETKGDYTLFSTGPEQWFVEAPVETHDDLAALLITDFKDNASVTEQTGAWCRFDLSGPACISVLERLCAIDSASMKGDDAVRSIIEHIGIFLLCRKEKTEFSVYAPCSFAGSLHHALTCAAKSAICLETSV